MERIARKRQQHEKAQRRLNVAKDIVASLRRGDGERRAIYHRSAGWWDTLDYWLGERDRLVKVVDQLNAEIKLWERVEGSRRT